MQERAIPKEWLVERLTSDDYLAACRADLVGAGFDEPLICSLLAGIEGKRDDQWQRLLAERKAGDELWHYRSSPASWASLSGCAGFAVVRSGVVIAAMNTMRS